MLCASPIDHWWTLFEHQDVVISQGCRDFYNQPATSRRYRKLIDANNLPDVYNAITYWRLSKTAQEFFTLVRNIFENWTDFKSLLKFPDEEPSTDVVYAMAAQIIGTKNVTLPGTLAPQIVHMKRTIIPTHTDDWTRELVWEHTDPGLRINTVAQWGMVHYHIKYLIGWQVVEPCLSLPSARATPMSEQFTIGRTRMRNLPHFIRSPVTRDKRRCLRNARPCVTRSLQTQYKPLGGVCRSIPG